MKKFSSLCPLVHCCPFLVYTCNFLMQKGTWTVRRIIFIRFSFRFTFLQNRTLLNILQVHAKRLHRIKSLQFNIMQWQLEILVKMKETEFKMYLYVELKSQIKLQVRKKSVIWSDLNYQMEYFCVSIVYNLWNNPHKHVWMRSFSTSDNVVPGNTYTLIGKSSYKSDKQMNKMKQKTI